jgi:hypothetical protein
LEFLVLLAVWFFLFILTFRSPGAPRLTRLALFLGWLGVSGFLALLFLIDVVGWDPNESKVRVANTLTDQKMIDLAQITQGVSDLDDIHRIDTDWEPESRNSSDNRAQDEWVVFYQYDVVDASSGQPTGPYGGAVYDHDRCRPPVIMSYELVPVDYDYLGEDAVNVKVDNIIEYNDPLSAVGGVPQDRPEVIITGATRGAVTDLNIFRKVGVDPDCYQWKQWRLAHPGEGFVSPLRYENIGSFRGSYRVGRSGSTVTVMDRAGIERSQLVVRKQYRPQNGTYFKTGTRELLDPVEYTLDFGAGEPSDVSQVYYPEKAVLAFYLALGKDRNSLRRAEGYLSQTAQAAYDIRTDPFGLSTDPASVARARSKLARVLVWEISYVPDAAAEQLHVDRLVTVTVVGVHENGNIDYAHPCQVTWSVVGVPNERALPNGYEWRLDRYESSCAPSAPEG